MIPILRPGQEPFEAEFILLDFEGTLASDRRVHPKAKDRINLLSKRVKIYILTNGEKETTEQTLRKAKAEIIYVTEGEGSKGKLDLLRRLPAARTVAIGNGVSDASMIGEAGFGICIISKEGTSVEAIRRADLVVSNVLDAFDFLLKPLRQKATLGQ